MDKLQCRYFIALVRNSGSEPTPEDCIVINHLVSEYGRTAVLKHAPNAEFIIKDGVTHFDESFNNLHQKNTKLRRTLGESLELKLPENCVTYLMTDGNFNPIDKYLKSIGVNIVLNNGQVTDAYVLVDTILSELLTDNHYETFDLIPCFSNPIYAFIELQKDTDRLAQLTKGAK